MSRSTTTAILTALDVRDVEPKDRYELIMGSYEALPTGASFELTVDHDPMCMYYTLRATRGDNSFAFDYLENGPETWRVGVTKRMADGGGTR
ncbi:MAG: DUF2249 domain-containing protein [Gemmatimonadota bacterium]